MRSKIESEFGADKLKHGTFNERFYIADYTERTGAKRDVEISNEAPTLNGEKIPAFVVENKNGYDITTIVFKPQCFMEDGKELSHCECVFYLSKNNSEKAVAFVEIKDCKPKNIGVWIKKAPEQLSNTITIFRKREIISATKTVYAIASFPRTTKTDFYTQVFRPPMGKKFKENHINVIAANRVELTNANRIKAVIPRKNK